MIDFMLNSFWKYVLIERHKRFKSLAVTPVIAYLISCLGRRTMTIVSHSISFGSSSFIKHC